MSSFKKSLAIVSLFGLIIGLFAFLSGPASAVDITTGDLVKSGSSKAVYYYGADGKRYCFPNENTYKTWYADFSSVKTISDAELAAIPLRGNVTYKPGIKMIKLATDPKVYAVAASGTLRWVATNTIAQALYNADWNAKVDDLADAFFVNYKVGLPITLTTEFNKTEIESAAKNIGVDKGIAADNTDGTTTLNAPVLTAPSTVATTTSFMLNWSTVANALTYLLEKSAEAAFTAPATFYSGANTSITDAITTTYYYRVKALKNMIASAWSNIAKVEIGCPILTAPVLTISAAAANSGANYSLNWTNLGATSYTLQRATDVSFANASNVGLTSLTAITAMENQNVSHDTTYYYRIKAANSCSESGWSNAVSVQVKLCPVLAAPTLTISANLANTGTNYSLNWTDLSAASYTLQKATDASFTSTTDIALTALNAVTAAENQTVNSDTTYYYRVKAANSCGDSAWSNAVNIKVVYVCPTPAAPVLTDPGTTITANTPAVLQWSAAADATEYVWDYYSDPTFMASIASSAGAATSVNLNTASVSTRYFRVRAVNACGTSPWSNVVDLVVKPAVVTLNVPGDYATIEAAIDAANAGDTIQLVAGNYLLGPTLQPKSNITIKGAGMDVTNIINSLYTRVVTIYQNSNLTISDLTIKNGYLNMGDGAGILINHSDNITLQNCKITNNMGWYGPGLYVQDGTNVLIKNCVIVGNSSDRHCATAGIAGNSSVTFENVTAADNTYKQGTVGGICAYDSSAVTVKNSIFWNNGASFSVSSGSTVNATYSDFKQAYTGTGNISQDPLFVGGGNYHLKQTSPAIDAGDPASAYGNEPAPNGSRINMGAYGNTASAEIKGISYDCAWEYWPHKIINADTREILWSCTWSKKYCYFGYAKCCSDGAHTDCISMN